MFNLILNLIFYYLIYLLYKSFFSKPKLNITLIKDESLNVGKELYFEIENIGNKATVLHPVVSSVFESVEGGQREMIFDVKDNDLYLPPFVKKILKATPREIQPGWLHGTNKHFCFDYDGGIIDISTD